MNMNRIIATTILSLALIVPANTAFAAPGLSQQMKINKAAEKITDRKCGKYSIKMSQAKADCRFKTLKSNGFIPLYDFDLGGPDVNTFEYNRSTSPASDAYATW